MNPIHMKNNKIIMILLILVLIASCKEENKKVEAKHEDHKITEKASTEKKKLSPHTSAMAMVGDAHIHIDYSSPGVRNRIIFGGLLPYNEVWQAGAHMATWLETNKDLTIGEKELKAGKYGFFVIPNKEEWTVIVNSNWDQHGKDEYDEKDDVLRFSTNPKISKNIQEHLEYTVNKTNDTLGTIKMSWEKVTIDFPFEVK